MGDQDANSSRTLEDPLLAARDDPTEDTRKSTTTAWVELKAIAHLAVGFFLANASWVVVKTTDTALLGHVSTQALEAAALSDFYTSCSGMFVQASVLTTFVSQAIGAGNPDLGAIWFQVSLACVLTLTVPVIILWIFTGPVLSALGTRQALADDAGYYATVLSICLPLQRILQGYCNLFSAHGLVYPAVYTTVFGAVVNLILGLFFVLGVPTQRSGFGFTACPWVTVFTEAAQLLAFYVVFCKTKQLHRRTCGFTAWLPKEITKERVVEYMRLFLPVALSTASDFWRIAVLAAFASSLGDLQVGVFNTSYRILWMTLTVIGALGTATGIRLGTALGEADATKARNIIRMGLAVTVSFLLTLTVTVFFLTREIAQVFSNDPKVLDLFMESRAPLCAMLFAMNFAMFLEAILGAMGRTRQIFYAGFVGSWLGQVPCTYIAICYWRRDMVGLYTGVSCGYGLLCLVLLALIAYSGVDSAIRDAQYRSNM